MMSLTTLESSRALAGLLLVMAMLASVACDEQPLSPSAGGLQGGEWALVQLLDGAAGPTATGGPATLIFESETRVNGFAGCNRFSGGYEATGDRLRFSALAMTRMACAAGMDVEQRYSQALERTQSYRLAGTRLELVDGPGTVAVLQRR